MQDTQSTQLTSQDALISQLTRLKDALKGELDHCYHYIHSLERDLKQTQLASTSTTITCPGGDSPELQLSELKHQLQKSNHKVREKRHQIKKLEKMNLHVEKALEEVIKEKEELQRLIEGMKTEILVVLDQKARKMAEQEVCICEQRQTIMLHVQELKSKGLNTQTVLGRVEELEKSHAENNKQIQQLRDTNGEMSRQLQEAQELLKEKEEAYQSLRSGIKVMETNHITQISRLGTQLAAKKKTQDSLEASSTSRVSILSSPRADSETRNWPVTRRITLEQHHLKQKQQKEKQQLLQSIGTLQQQIHTIQHERAKEQEQTTKLKNDLINMKVEHTNILIKNNQLIEINVRLERQKNDLFVKLEGVNAGKTVGIPTDRSIGSQSVRKTNLPLHRANTTAGSISLNRTRASDDGEVPVRDPSSTRCSHVFVTANSHQNIPNAIRKIGLPSSQSNLLTFSSLK